MLVPPLEVAHVNSPHRGLRQLESASHLTRRRTFAGLPDNLFEPLAERCLGGQLLDLLHADSALRTPQPMHFHNYRGAIYAPGQVPDFALAHIVHRVQSSPTSATLKPPVDRLATDPQFQCLRRFVQLVPVHSIPRPSQDRCPFFVCQLPSVAKNPDTLNYRWLAAFHEFLRRAQLFKWVKQHLRIKALFGTSENAVKTQIWIAVSVYVLVALIR